MFDNKLVVDFDEKKIDALFADIDQSHLPGAAVGIAIQGKPVYRKGFGLASMDLPMVLSPAMRIRIGSTTKHFTCLAYLLLCEEGRAAIDDPIGKYLPELHPVARQATLRQLMGNISGLRDACDIKLLFGGLGGRAVSSAELVSLYEDIDDVNAPPGTAFIYNNGGYLLLSAAIERIAGLPLEDVLRQRIFEPVGMHSTLLRRWDTDFVPNSATPHMRSPAGDFERLGWGLDFAGGGAMVATIDDMLRWLAHMDQPVVGSADTWAALKTPQVLANRTSSGYGLGLFTARYRGVETLSHAGSWTGGNAQMLKVPAAGLDIVIMVNRHDVSGMVLANQIVDACVAELDPAKSIASTPLASGVFRSPTTGRVVQLCGTQQQPIVSVDGHDWPCSYGEDGVMRPISVWSYVKYEVTLAGDREKPTSIQFRDFGNLDELLREKPVVEPDVGMIAGRYRSNSTGTEAVIDAADAGPRLTSGRFGSARFDLECLSGTAWRATQRCVLEGWGGAMVFDAVGATFRFFSHGTQGLIFRRDV